MSKPFEVGKVYKTYKGHDVRIVCTDKISLYGFSIVGLRTDPYGNTEITVCYKADGSPSTNSESPLIPEQETITQYVNVFDGTTDRWKLRGGKPFCHWHNTENEARISAALVTRNGEYKSFVIARPITIEI